MLGNCCVQNEAASEAQETHYESTLPQDSSFSESVASAAVDSQTEIHSSDTQYEEKASDEDSDSDDANTSRHRDRFRTERDTSSAATLRLPVANKAEKRDIPDTLGEDH